MEVWLQEVEDIDCVDGSRISSQDLYIYMKELDILFSYDSIYGIDVWRPNPSFFVDCDKTKVTKIGKL